MSAHSSQNLDELVEDLKLDKTGIKYMEWKSEVQQVAKGDTTF